MNQYHANPSRSLPQSTQRCKHTQQPSSLSAMNSSSITASGSIARCGAHSRHGQDWNDILQPSSWDTESSEGPTDKAEQRRRQNSEASRRFRARKKEQDKNIETLLVDAAEENDDLRRRNAILQAENQLLKDLMGTNGAGSAINGKLSNNK